MTIATSRRSFCHILAGLIVFGFGRRAPTSADPLVRRLSQFFADADSAKVVGREYLRAVPTEAEQSRLLDLICAASAAGRTELVRADDTLLRALLVLRQRHDFEHGRVVRVRGWILSETECRLCALAVVAAV